MAKMHASQDYGSEFEYDSEVDRKRKRRSDLAEPEKAKKTKLPSKHEVTDEYNKEEGRIMRYHIISMDAYSRHKKYVNDYLRFYGGSRAEFQRDSSKDRNDYDVIRENHRFLWTDEDDADGDWEKSLAKRYWDKLFKEYCITDLSRYKENKVAMRWRVEKEVVSGKGQFSCGNKHCDVGERLRSWEVNFAYMEHGEKKNALVKLRLCPQCSDKLNFYHRRKEVVKTKKTKAPEVKKEPAKKTSKKKSKKRHKHKRRSSSSSSEGAVSDDDAWVEKADVSGGDTTTPSDRDQQGSAEQTDLWKGPVKITEEKTREEEFEDYFEDMFL